MQVKNHCWLTPAVRARPGLPQQGDDEWQVRFLPCFVYKLWHQGRAREVLVEDELEGRFIKWWVAAVVTKCLMKT